MFATITLLVLIAQSDYLPQPAQDALLAAKFTKLPEYRNPASPNFGAMRGFGWRLREKFATMNIQVEYLNGDALIGAVWQNYKRGFARWSEEPTYPPSGILFGQRLFFSVGASIGSSDLASFSKEVCVQVTIRRSVKNEKMGWGREEAELFETVARWTMADAAAKVMTNQPAVVNGLVVSGLKTRSNVLLANAREYAAKRGWSYGLDKKSAMATIGSGTNQVLIPLASPAIRVKGVWRNLPHIIVVVGLDPYLPIEELERLGPTSSSQGAEGMPLN